MTRPSFALPDRLDPEDLRSRCLPPFSTYPKKMRRKTFFFTKLVETHSAHRRDRLMFNHRHTRNYWPKKLVLRITTHFGVCPCVEKSCTLRRKQQHSVESSHHFLQVQTAEVSRRYLLLPCVLLFQRCRLSWIDRVLNVP